MLRDSPPGHSAHPGVAIVVAFAAASISQPDEAERLRERERTVMKPSFYMAIVLAPVTVFSPTSHASNLVPRGVPQKLFRPGTDCSAMANSD